MMEGKRLLFSNFFILPQSVKKRTEKNDLNLKKKKLNGIEVGKGERVLFLYRCWSAFLFVRLPFFITFSVFSLLDNLFIIPSYH